MDVATIRREKTIDTYYKVKCIYCGKEQTKAITKKETKCECQYILNHHHKSNTPLYSVYKGIKRRCYNPNDINYKNYGARGIKVCDEWLNDFQTFYDWAISNGYNEDLSIDRVNVNGNYEPSNCRWVNKETQSNNKRNNRLITFNGETKTIAQWGKAIGIDKNILYERLNKLGWSIEDTLTTPLLTRFSGRRKEANNMNLRINLIKFRKTREAGKRSITYFADVLGITRQHYTDIENGKSNPSFGLMQRFEEVFKNQYEDIWELFKKSE